MPDTKATAKGYAYVNAITPYQQEFETELEALLTELLNAEIPFLQTEDRQLCSKCAYNRICQRA